MKRLKTWILMAAIPAAIVLHASWPHLSEDAEAEMERLAGLLALRSSATVADIGAGDGQLAILAARRVGPEGSVFATEVEADDRSAIRLRAAQAGLENVEVLEALGDASGLPNVCCDAIYLRKVYHHVGDPSAFAADLLRAIRPGGRVGIIDFTPGSRWFLPTPSGVPDSRSGHGVSPEAVIAEMNAAGFQLRERVGGWPGRAYCLVFKRSAD